MARLFHDLDGGWPQSKSPSLLCGSSDFFLRAYSNYVRIRHIKKARRYALGFLFGRDGEIRTHDPLHPMQVRYRAALHPDFLRWLPNKIPVNGRMGTGHPLRDGKNKCYFLILVGTGINLNAENEFDFLILFRN